MRKIGRFILILIAVGAVAGVYVITPHLFHSPSRVFNFLQLIGVAGGLFVVLLLACAALVMGTGRRGIGKAAPPEMGTVARPLEPNYNPGVVPRAARVDTPSGKAPAPEPTATVLTNKNGSDPHYALRQQMWNLLTPAEQRRALLDFHFSRGDVTENPS